MEMRSPPQSLVRRRQDHFENLPTRTTAQRRHIQIVLSDRIDSEGWVGQRGHNVDMNMTRIIAPSTLRV